MRNVNMEPSERDRYLAALRVKEAALLSSLRKREGLAAESEPDVFDEAQSAMDRALVIERLDRNSALLRDVQSALERVADGSYGQCLDCAEDISPKRLAVAPWANLCLKCQERADRREQGQHEDTDFLRAA